MSPDTIYGGAEIYAGAKLKPFPANLMNAAFKASMRLYAELSEQNPVWSKVFADEAKFRVEQNLQFRLPRQSLTALCRGKSYSTYFKQLRVKTGSVLCTTLTK